MFAQLQEMPKAPPKPIALGDTPAVITGRTASVEVINHGDKDEMIVVGRKSEDWLAGRQRDEQERARLLANLNPSDEHMGARTHDALSFDVGGAGVGVGPGAAGPGAGPPMKKSGTSAMVPIISIKVPK